MGDYHRGYNHRDMPPLPTRDMMGSRIYVGKLPIDIREREIEKAFGKYGDIQDISLKGNYCFIQFERSGAAKEAVYELNDRTLFGDRIQVEHARTPKEFAGFRSRNSSYRSSGGGRYRSGYRDSDRRERERRRERSRSPARSDYRLNVTNLSTRCDRRDLKAVMEKAGEVLYADAHRKKIGEGFVEFSSRKDMERALNKLDGLEINAKPIKLEIEAKRSRRSRSGSKSKSRSRSKSKSRSRSKSKSRSRSKSKSRSRSKSKSHSRSKSKSHSRSCSASGEKSDKEDLDKSKDKERDGENDGAKSDDDEFDAAERSVKRKKEKNGCESDSEKGESATKKSRSESDQCEKTGEHDMHGEADDETSELNVTHTSEPADAETEGSEETEEVEEIVEEEVEEEVEVDEDEDSLSASDEKGKTESLESDHEDV